MTNTTNAASVANHIEQRLLTWRQSFVNTSGDQLALDDFMGQGSIDDLVDFVCDEAALSAALAAQPQAAQAVPQGWKMVPDAPTPEWIEAIVAAGGVRIGSIESVIADVLAAAPSAPEQPEPHPPMRDCGCADCLPSFHDPVAWLRAGATLPEYGGVMVWKNDGTAFPVFRHPERTPLTDDQIDAIAEGMPDGLSGFLKSWGWRQFARAIEAAAPCPPAHPRSCVWRTVPLGMPEAGPVFLLLQDGRQAPFYIRRSEAIMHGARPILDLPSDATHWRP